MPVRSPPAAPVGAAPVIVTFAAVVMRPCASTVKLGTCVALPYGPAVTPVLESFDDVIAPSVTLVVVTALSARSADTIVPSWIFADVTALFASFSVVTASSASFAFVTALSASLFVVTAASASLALLTALFAIVGFGYVPVRSPPALPVGAIPEIVTLPAVERRPCASTVNVATCVALP